MLMSSLAGAVTSLLLGQKCYSEPQIMGCEATTTIIVCLSAGLWQVKKREMHYIFTSFDVSRLTREQAQV